MPVVVEKEKKTQEVNFLSDVDPTFVSLVQHGANRQPFRIVKSEVKGGERMFFVQSILLPNGVKLEDLAAKDDLRWLSDCSQDLTKSQDGYRKLIQKSMEKFDADSMQLVKLDKSGAYALVGKLQGSPDGTEMTLGEEQLEALRKITSVLDEPLEPEQPAPGVVRTFGEVFDMELFSMMDVIHGALRQKEQTPAQRRKIVLGAIDAFKSFMSMSLDQIGKEAVAVRGKIEPKADAQDKGDGETMPFQFESKEEFAAAVTDIVAAAIEAKLEKAPVEDPKEPEKVEAKEPEKVEAKDDNKELKDMILDLGKKVDTIATKQETMENQLVTTPGANEDSDPQEPLEKVDPNSDQGVFSGLIFNKAKLSEIRKAV